MITISPPRPSPLQKMQSYMATCSPNLSQWSLENKDRYFLLKINADANTMTPMQALEMCQLWRQHDPGSPEMETIYNDLKQYLFRLK